MLIRIILAAVFIFALGGESFSGDSCKEEQSASTWRNLLTKPTTFSAFYAGANSLTLGATLIPIKVDNVNDTYGIGLNYQLSIGTLLRSVKYSIAPCGSAVSRIFLDNTTFFSNYSIQDVMRATDFSFQIQDALSSHRRPGTVRAIGIRYDLNLDKFFQP